MQGFIVFEGIDGCGKSTQVRLLVEALKAKGLEVIQTREPGGTPIAEEIRTLLLSRDLDVLTEFMLLSAARHEHVRTLIHPSLEAGKFVVCDRFYGSTIAYQCYAKGLAQQFVHEVTNVVLGDTRPTLTFLLDLTPEEALLRRQNRMLQSNHYDEQSLEFHQRVRQGFLEIAANENWVALDALLTEQEIAQQVLNIVAEKL